jgi:TolB-like protein
MRRRHVVRFSITYAAAAFVILQLAEIVFPAFGIGEGGLRLLVAGVTLGFLPAVVLAWIYDVTREGIRRTEEGPERRTPYRVALATFALVTIALTGGVGWYLYQHGFFEEAAPELNGLAYDPNQPIRSLVVLPLEDNSPGGEGYLASGMHDEIIAQLSTIEGMRVVSRTTSMRYGSSTLSVPEIGSQLGVDVVVEGSVTQAGDQVRISLRVIHAASDATIETLQVEGSADDLLSLQEDVAQRVATVIGSTYGRGGLGRTAEGIPRAAQEAYYRARYEMERRSPDAYQRALDLFLEATRTAPGFAEAWAGLASARFRLAAVSLRADPRERTEQFDRAEREAEEAVTLDSTSMAVQEVYDRIHAVRTQVAARTADSLAGRTLDGRRGAAPDSIAIGVGAVDMLWLASMSTFGQQVMEGVRDMEGPEAAEQLTLRARVAMAQGDFPAAVELLDSTVVAYPQTQEAWDQLLRAHVSLGHLDELAGVVQRWNEAGAPGAPGEDGLARLRTAIAENGLRGYWTWRRDYLLAQQAAGEQIVLTDLAAAYLASGGERARVFELLRQALDAEELRLYAVPSDPVWDPLRGDPRFRQIEEEIQRRRLDLSLEIGTTGGAPNN